MDWLVDQLRTNVVLMFWLLWSPEWAFCFGLIPYGGIVTYARVLFENKLYFGVYMAFIVMTVVLGVCSSVASKILDGRTPDAVYTEIWFYLALCVPISFLLLSSKGMRHETARKRLDRLE